MRWRPAGRDIKLGGTSPRKQALAAGLCDEIIVHLAPLLLGGGVRLFDTLPDGIRLDKLSVRDGPFAAHLRYRVIRDGMQLSTASDGFARLVCHAILGRRNRDSRGGADMSKWLPDLSGCSDSLLGKVA